MDGGLVKERVRPVRLMARFLDTHARVLQRALGALEPSAVSLERSQAALAAAGAAGSGEDSGLADTSLYGLLSALFRPASAYREAFVALRGQSREGAMAHIASCRRFREATLPFVRAAKADLKAIVAALDEAAPGRLGGDFEKLYLELRGACR